VRRLDRTVLSTNNSAPSLDVGYRSLAKRRIGIRKGEVSLIAAQSGVGKSTLALSMTMRSKAPTIYFSADTHAHTMEMRTIAMLTNTPQETVETLIAQDRQWAADVIKQASHIKWNFDSAPDVTLIENEIKAHIELTSHAPELVVVDNLTDCIVDSGNEYAEMKAMLKDFKYLAREYDTAFLVLAHVSDGVIVTDGQCPPKGKILGQIGATPCLILTLAQWNDHLGVCPVKNRYGKASPAGNDVSWLSYAPDTMQVGELEVAA